MFKLKTERLTIIPLDVENFKLLIEDMKSVEKNLGVVVTGNELSQEMKEIFRKSYEKAVNDKDNYLWYTNWQIILNRENRIICGIIFKGVPNDNGEVEVGYGTDEKFQNKGYMTEALKKVIEWAFEQDSVKSVIAETGKNNKPSQRVLEKVGMRKYKETEKYYWYRIDK